VHFVLKVPLSQLQREWYKRFLEKSLEVREVTVVVLFLMRTVRLTEFILY
jgi:hypothetical protein